MSSYNWENNYTPQEIIYLQTSFLQAQYFNNLCEFVSLELQVLQWAH